MDKSEFPLDFDSVHSQPDDTLPNHYEDTSVIYPPVNYVPGRLFRPRMVARSSVNSKRLSNTTISLISIPAQDHTTPMPSMQRINRIPHLNQSVNSNARLSVLSGTQSAQETNPQLGSYRRGPISNPLSAVTATTGRGGESQSFPASFYPVSVGGGATGGTGAAGGADEGAHLLNIDDLLIRRNRPTSKTSSSRGRHNTRSAQQPLPPLVVVGSGSPSAPPVISYQENAIQTRLELLPTVPDRNNDSNVYQCEKEQEEMEKLAKPPPALVELMLIFVKIGQVDTVNERYQADIFLQARWREPLLDATWKSERAQKNWRGKSGVENPIQDLVPKRHLHTLGLQDDEFWNPRLLLDNAQGEPIEIVSHEVEFVEPTFEAYLVEKRRIKGVFHETLELKHFPFDVQDLSVTVTCDRSVDEVLLVPSPTEVSQVDRRGAADSQEWKIFHHVDVERMEIQTAYSPGTSKRRHPGLVFTSRSARRSGYFMVNMVLISCVLCLLSFCIFSVPVDGNRLQQALLLLLTTVTFKFAASQNLPKISYLTYLDKVVLANFFMLVILTVWHTIARSLSASYPKLLDNEKYVVYTLLSSYCLGAVIFGLTVYLDAGSRRRLMQRKDVEFGQLKTRIEREKQRTSIVTVSLDDWLNAPHTNYTGSDLIINSNNTLIVDQEDRQYGIR